MKLCWAIYLAEKRTVQHQRSRRHLNPDAAATGGGNYAALISRHTAAPVTTGSKEHYVAWWRNSAGAVEGRHWY